MLTVPSVQTAAGIRAEPEAAAALGIEMRRLREPPGATWIDQSLLKTTNRHRFRAADLCALLFRCYAVVFPQKNSAGGITSCL